MVSMGPSNQVILENNPTGREALVFLCSASVRERLLKPSTGYLISSIRRQWKKSGLRLTHSN